MDYSRSTILITGGSTGIGGALATRFAKIGSTVIICSRSVERLREAKERTPSLHTIQCDVSREADRRTLAERVTLEFPSLNVLINNAGIQNRPVPLSQPQEWSHYQHELATNLEAPMHLSFLLTPHLMKSPEAAIMNVTSGLAFSPLSFMAGYCATKAALRSFTLSLRHQLKDTSVAVVEIVPPKVNTDLGGKGLHDDGAPLDGFADEVFEKILSGEKEVGFGFSNVARRASREELDQIFQKLNP